VAIICHKVIPKEEATKYGIKALWLFWNGGYIERHKLKKSTLITIFDGDGHKISSNEIIHLYPLEIIITCDDFFKNLIILL
jgi:hypothetical protein